MTVYSVMITVVYAFASFETSLKLPFSINAFFEISLDKSVPFFTNAAFLSFALFSLPFLSVYVILSIFTSTKSSALISSVLHCSEISAKTTLPLPVPFFFTYALTSYPKRY